MSYAVAVIGATGNVGREMLNILAERNFPVVMDAVASRRSQGKEVSFGDKTLNCQALEFYDFAAADIALFACGSGPAEEYAPRPPPPAVWSSTIPRSIVWKRMYR